MENFRNEKRTCPYSGEEFYPKRHNQRFACAKYRVAFHNDANNKIRRGRAFIDNKLHKNYQILLELMDDKERGVFHKQFLLGSGYSFNVMTHFEYYESHNRQAVYDFIIIPDTINVTIIKTKK